MEAIRKKMSGLKTRLEEEEEKCKDLEKQKQEMEERADAAEAEVKNLNSKLILLEEDNGKQEEALGDTRRRLETVEVEADENLR
ncbi:tropomyosin-1-like [Lytechinus pictus]|uniref:tropomyosin-1-like n=1 Tax=Lytechinus pictus TaxID=7653 RepID=UPI00240E002E|nr:tropomyosin-1-like [Lytechinus pictus]